MAQKWYNLTVEQTQAKLNTDLENGLPKRAAQKRIHREKGNNVFITQKTPVGKLIGDVLRDPFSFLLLAMAILAHIFEQQICAAAIFALVIFNIIGVSIAYIRSHKRIEGAAEEAIPSATVLRGGRQYIVKHNKICRGDVIILKKGDVVPADARIIESDSLEALEVSLTGDIRIKKKNEKVIYANNLSPNMQSNMVFATTVISNGSGRAVVCETGDDTLASILSRNTSIAEHDKLSALTSLKKYCSTWSIVILTLIFMLTVLNLIIGVESRGIFNIFITGLALATAAMSEYYVIFGYIIIGCGLYKSETGDKNERIGAIVKKSASIDTISKITTLILPNDGAFCAGSIKLEKLWCDGTIFSANEKRLSNNCGELISCALDSTSYPENGFEKAYNRHKSRNLPAEEKLFLSLAKRSGVFSDDYPKTHLLLDHYDSPEEGAIAKTLIKTDSQNKLILRGSIDEILPLCSNYRTLEKLKSIKTIKQKLIRTANNCSSDGYCVIALASKYTNESKINPNEIKEDFIFEGFCIISEPKLSGAKENVEKLKSAGIHMIMLSDEASVSNRSYAKSLGIIESDSQVMTSETLRGMADDLFRTNVTLYGMYEGLDTSQKRLLLKHLQANGEVVGFFGNDFDDIILLKESNVGYSSGITLAHSSASIELGSDDSPVFIQSNSFSQKGSEALKLVCDVIVSPANKRGGGFNAIAQSIERSGTVFANLSRMVRYLITSQCARFFTLLYSVLAFGARTVFNGEDIMTPVQLLFLGAILDFAIVMAIAFSPAENYGKKRGYQNDSKNPVAGNILPMLFGLFIAVLSVAIPVLARLLGLDISDRAMSGIVFYSFILSQIISAAETISEKPVLKGGFHPKRSFIISLPIIIAFIAATAYIPVLQNVFNTTSLSVLQWLIVLTIPVILFAVYEIYRHIRRPEQRVTEQAEDEKQSIDTLVEAKSETTEDTHFDTGFDLRKELERAIIENEVLKEDQTSNETDKNDNETENNNTENEIIETKYEKTDKPEIESVKESINNSESEDQPEDNNDDSDTKSEEQR